MTKPKSVMPIALAALLSIHCSEMRADEVEDEIPITAADRAHWSFAPLARPALPVVDDSSWARNPIDLFVLSAWQRRGITPLPAADRPTLLRRLAIDLLGLPPTPEQLATWLSDSGPGNDERLVDRLLASPDHGLRWAQHWLDLARFAETDGFEHDQIRDQAWLYRDWVIDTLNADMPYDQFVSWQVAGDQLEPGNESARIATGFCLAGPDMPDINLQEERRHYLLNSITSVVGSVFLGLQMECAQCHDHKYDPISQADFYRLRAFFEPAVAVRANRSVSFLRETGKRAPAHLMIRGDFRRPGPRVDAAFPRVANPWNVSPTTGEAGQRVALARWLTRDDHPLTARVIANRLWQYHFSQGLSRSPSDFGVMGEEPLHRELLDWLATELVTHDWSLKHLHRLIVTSATYRLSSRAPQADRTGAVDDAALQMWQRSLATDPHNEYLSRFPRRRLTGEAIRDAMLSTAGTLSTSRGGPGVRPPLPPEMVSTLLRNQWQVSENRADHMRRSIYVFARRNLRYPVFDVFDRPDGNASCARRSQSTTATQSLLMLNSTFAFSLARQFAGRVLAEEPRDTGAQIELAVRLAYARPPSADERHRLRRFLDQQSAVLRRAERTAADLALPLPYPESAEIYRAAALTDLCLALFNSNEFVYVD